MLSVPEALLEGVPVKARWRDKFGSAGLAMLVLAAGGMAQGLTYLNHDVAWVLASSERLLHGGIFGNAIVAANPPLIWWLSAVVAWISDILGVDPILVFRIAVLLLAAGALTSVDRILSGRRERRARQVLLVVLALIVTLLVHRDFGQREHLAVLLCLPWLMIVAKRADGVAVCTIHAIPAGIAAGIGIAFKPHFLAVLALVWIYAGLRRRSLRSILTQETALIALTGAVYVLAVWIFARPYLTEVVPLISQVYWGFDFPLSEVIRAKLFIISLSGIAVAFCAASGWRSDESVTATAAAGFLVAALAQSKGYSYHFYPTLALSLMSIALVALSVDRTLLRRIASGVLGLGLVFATVQAAPTLLRRSAAGTYGQMTACLVNMVNVNVPEGQGFMALSTHPFPGFPVANYADRRWVAATNSRLFLPAIARLRSAEALGPRQRNILQLAETSERAAVLRDIARKPALVLVDARQVRHAIGTIPMDFVAFYRKDPAFARIWAQYREIPSCAGFHAYRRIKEH